MDIFPMDIPKMISPSPSARLLPARGLPTRHAAGRLRRFRRIFRRIRRPRLRRRSARSLRGGPGHGVPSARGSQAVAAVLCLGMDGLGWDGNGLGIDGN